MTKIFCCACQREVEAVLTDGAAIYRSRPDMSNRPFWQCPCCLNHVGCHWKTHDPTRPLGTIPSPEMREVRRRIHSLLTSAQHKGHSASSVYRKMAQRLNTRSYHTVQLRGLDEHLKALETAAQLAA